MELYSENKKEGKVLGTGEATLVNSKKAQKILKDSVENMKILESVENKEGEETMKATKTITYGEVMFLFENLMAMAQSQTPVSGKWGFASNKNRVVLRHSIQKNEKMLNLIKKREEHHQKLQEVAKSCMVDVEVEGKVVDGNSKTERKLDKEAFTKARASMDKEFSGVQEEFDKVSLELADMELISTNPEDAPNLDQNMIDSFIALGLIG
jgi:hypothetical protein